MDNLNLDRLSEEDILNMQERQEKTLSDIKDLQQRERDIYNNIDVDLANENLSKDKLKSKIGQVNELISIRDNLFKNLGDIYKFQKDSVSDSRNDLVNRITTTRILENELSNVKKHYDNLDREKRTKVRMNQINIYYTKKYSAQTKMMKSLLLFVFIILVLSILKVKTKMPKMLCNLLIITAGVMGLLKFIYDYYDISRRSKMDFDKYDYSWWKKENKNDGDEEDSDTELGYIDKAVDDADNSGFKLPSVCYNEHCCNDETTYDTDLGRCVPKSVETFKPNQSESEYNVTIF